MFERVKKYVEIVPQDIDTKKYKTKKWFVLIRGVDIAGEIIWYGGWRKYVFEQYEAHSFYDWDFLRYIADFCEAQTQAHYGKFPIRPPYNPKP